MRVKDYQRYLFILLLTAVLKSQLRKFAALAANRCRRGKYLLFLKVRDFLARE